jgi:VCBS repeat-containing protein
MAEPIGSQQALSQSADGNLYNALSGDGAAASLIGWLVFTTTGDLQKGLDAMAAVNGGSFSVSTTQVAAQTKSLAEAQGTTDINGTPTATIVIDGVSYDISSLLSSTVYYWANTTGNGKNAQTNYHMREVFTGLGDAPDDYDPNWDAANNAPEATPFSVEATETLSVYDANHEITNRPPTDILEIDLRNGATDADSDPLSVVGSVTLTGNTGSLTLTEGTTWWVSGNTLYIDQNSAELDDLLNGDTDTLTFSYSLTDGKSDPVETYVTVEITGTADQYNQSGTGFDVNVHDKANGNQNNQVLYVDQSVFHGMRSISRSPARSPCRRPASRPARRRNKAPCPTSMPTTGPTPPSRSATARRRKVNRWTLPAPSTISRSTTISASTAKPTTATLSRSLSTTITTTGTRPERAATPQPRKGGARGAPFLWRPSGGR